MVNPTLTYDNEYNRRLRDIFSEYDDIQASSNPPTMIVGGIRQMDYINSGNTPYDGREGTAPFSGSMYGGMRRHLLDTPITDMRYRGRPPPKAPSRAEIETAYKKATGGVNRNKKAKKWLNFSVDAVRQGMDLANTGRTLFGRGKGGFLRYMPKVMAYNAINNATGRHLPSLFGGAEGGFSVDELVGNTNKSARQRAYNTASRRDQKIMARNDPSLRGGVSNLLGYDAGAGLPKKIGKKVGRAVSERGAVVSQVMKEHGLSLSKASKFVKDNGLY
jgi:hypothetical protein